MRTAIFDLDGTLADTSADLLNTANACFGAPVLELSRDKLVAFRGARALLSLGFQRLGRTGDDAELTRWQQKFLTIYADALHVEICTNKPFHLADPLLKSLAIHDRFGAILGADSLPVRKPDPKHLLETIARVGGSAERAVLVGDTVTDRDAARNANVPCVLVEFGPLGPSIAELEPAALLPHYDALSEVLGRVVA